MPDVYDFEISLIYIFSYKTSGVQSEDLSQKQADRQNNLKTKIVISNSSVQTIFSRNCHSSPHVRRVKLVALHHTQLLLSFYLFLYFKDLVSSVCVPFCLWTMCQVPRSGGGNHIPWTLKYEQYEPLNVGAENKLRTSVRAAVIPAFGQWF